MALEFHKEINFSRWDGPYLKYNIFNFTWHIGNFCNYHCSYCPPFLNNGSKDSWVPLDVAKKVLDNVESQVSDKNIMLIYSGGEPTVHPNFLEIVEYSVKEKNMFAAVITNGSRSPAYYEKLGKIVNGSVVFSYHFEYAKFDKFLESIRAYTSVNNRAYIHFIMNPNYWEDSVKYFEYLIQEGFKTIPKTLIDDKTTMNEDVTGYSEEQKRYLVEANKISSDNINFPKGLNFSHAYKWKNNKIVGDTLLVDMYDEEERKKTMSVHQILIEKRNFLQGIKCWAGVEGIHIGWSGDVYKGACEQDGKIANIYKNPDFLLPQKPTTCTKAIGCWCVDDLKYTKQKF